MKKTELNAVSEELYTDGIHLFCYSLADSTNKRARCYIEENASTAKLPVLFFADGQTAGRGRLGRSFFSPSHSGVYMTLLLKAPKNSQTFTRITSLCAVSAADAIYRELGVKVLIKWVNDLYLDGKKVAGILAESFEQGGERYVALGIGINIFSSELPDDIKDKAGFIIGGASDGSRAQRLHLAISVAKELIAALDSDDVSKYMEKYRSLSCVIGERISFVRENMRQSGRAIDVTDLGALTVELDSKEIIELSTGEISIFVEKGEEQ